MAYCYDGHYCIDNSIVECSIRPLAIERKNKMAFGCHQGAKTSMVYHTFTVTCRMNRYTVILSIFEELFHSFLWRNVQVLRI